MGGVPKDPGYWRKWRASHPEYRKREALRRIRRRSVMTSEQRRVDRGRRRATAPEPIPSLHLGSDVFAHAKAIARCASGYHYLTHPFYDDLIGEIVLALVSGESPAAARRRFLRSEYAWRRNTLQVLDGLEPVGGRLVPQGDWIEGDPR